MAEHCQHCAEVADHYRQKEREAVALLRRARAWVTHDENGCADFENGCDIDKLQDAIDAHLEGTERRENAKQEQAD